MQKNSKLNKSFNLTNRGVILNGDCLNFLKHLKGNSVDLIVTDPPYEIETNGAGLYKQKDKQYVKELNSIKNGFDELILDEMIRVQKKVNIYLFCSQKQIPKLLDYFLKNKDNPNHVLYRRQINWNLLTWHKTNPVPACGNKYLTDTEYILFFRESGVKVYGEFKTKFTYYVTPLNQKDKKKYHHPTIKPLEIINNLVINSSQEKDVVLDPFMGSGTTCVSALLNNRKFIGMEIDESYYDIAKKRIEEMLDFQENYIEEK